MSSYTGPFPKIEDPNGLSEHELNRQKGFKNAKFENAAKYFPKRAVRQSNTPDRQWDKPREAV